MMDPGEVIVALGAFTAIALAIKTVASAVLKYQENKLRIESSGSRGVAEARLERIEHAVDAIAVEIERISEGQRFTTKLLSERVPTH
jgi:hypothetical protein